MFSSMNDAADWRTERRFWWIAAAIIYLLLLVFLLIIPNNYRSHNVLMGGLTWELWSDYVARGFNLIPFSSLIQQFGSIASGDAAARHLIYLLGNSIGFIPLGFLLPLLFIRQRKVGKFMLTAFLMFAALELGQLLSMRGLFDIDDIILYGVGAALGFVLFRKWSQRRNPSS
jgi:glycopeptide antibiotics resistance protein